MNPSDTYAIRHLVLGQVRHYAEERIPGAEVHADVFWSELADRTEELVLRLEAHVWGEQRVKLSRDVEFRVPASWWDQLKERHFPSWAWRRWPAEYRLVRRTVTFAEYLTFPAADLSVRPGLGRPVRVQTSVVE